MENRRIIFMGTPKIASVVLKTMLENDIHVGLVVTQPDKKKGRNTTACLFGSQRSGFRI